MRKLSLYFKYPFWKHEYKFYVWGRHIESEIERIKTYEPEKLKPYLKKVKELRERFLDKKELTPIEKSYTPKIQKEIEREDREVAKLERMIEKRETKELDQWTKRYLAEGRFWAKQERKDERYWEKANRF